MKTENEVNLEIFMINLGRIQPLLDQLQDLADNHFEKDPGHIGDDDIDYVIDVAYQLQKIIDAA